MTSVEKMRCKGTAYRLQGIMKCFDKGCAAQDEIEEMKKLTNDMRILGGRYISCYALTVLDLLGIEKYDGNDEDVLFLIANLKRPVFGD